MTLREALVQGAKILEEAEVFEAAENARILLEKVAQIDRAHFYLEQNSQLENDKEAEYFALIKRRASHIPVQYILGEQNFYGLNFKVNENVLIPRQDTEILVDETLKVIKEGMSLLDMCTGSGCVLLAVMSNCRDVIGTGADISEAALRIARENADNLKLSASFICSNLFEKIEGSYDIITANPPYIASEVIKTLEPEVKVFEPMNALDGGKDGLDLYEPLTREAANHLVPGGYFLTEIGHDQGEAVAAIFRECGYINVEIIKDYAGNDRVVKGQLCLIN